MKLFGSFTLLVLLAAVMIQESNGSFSNRAAGDVQVNAAREVAADAHVAANAQVSHKKLVKHHKKKKHVKKVKHTKGFVPRTDLTPQEIKQKNKIKSLLVKVPKMKATARIMQTIQTGKKAVAPKACTKASQCEADQYCSSKVNQCKRKLAEGKNCSSNAACAGSLCQATTGLCASVNLKNGLTCSKSTQCKSGNCTKARCADKQDNGTACTKDVNCISAYCSVKTSKCAKKPATPTTTTTTAAPEASTTPEEPTLTDQQQLDYVCYTELKAERPAQQIVEEFADALSTVTQDVYATGWEWSTRTVTAGAAATPRSVADKRQISDEAIAILTNPNSTPEQVKAVTDAISASYGQDIISQACFEMVYNGEFEVIYTTTTPAVETEFRTTSTSTQWLATVTVAAQVEARATN